MLFHFSLRSTCLVTVLLSLLTVFLSMPRPAKSEVIAQAIANRKQHIASRKAAGNPTAKFEARTPADESRRRARERMRKHRAAKRPAAAYCAAAKRAPAAAKRPAASAVSRHIPLNCCGRRKANCRCFKEGRGLEIARSLKRKIIKPIAGKVLKSRIQTWRDTGDMRAYRNQVGWQRSFRYSWLFPIAFLWRHFSNEHLWTALQNIGAVTKNKTPNFTIIEEAMRSFDASNISYHGGLFFSGSMLTEYRFGSAAKPAKWQNCADNQDFHLQRSPRLESHVARS